MVSKNDCAYSLFSVGSIESANKKEFSAWWKDLNKAADGFGNVLIKYPANIILIKDTGYKFGKYPDMISKVLGVNKLMGTLKKWGKRISNGLNRIDKNHVEKAIQNNKNK